MVTQCLEYNYAANNETKPCNGSYESCSRYVDCQFGMNHSCFAVYESKDNPRPFSAGCISVTIDKCETECIGQKRGIRYYCCCKDHLCNTKIKLGIPDEKEEPLVPPHSLNDTYSDIQPDHTVTPWSVIPIVFLVLMIGFIYFYWYKRGSPKNRNSAHNSIYNSSNQNNDLTNRRNKDFSGNLNDSELHQLRNNHDVSILAPFNNHYGDETYFNDSNHINNSHQHTSPMTNHHLHHPHHDANNSNLSQQEQQQQQQLACNDYRIDLNNINLLEIIGSGRFGTVHRASLNNEPDSEIAVKITTPSDIQSFKNEVEIYRSPRIKHPNILNYLYSDGHPETETYWLVVEYASKGSLYSFLEANVVTWKEFIDIALGIVRGLSHLHESEIAHRDFKSKNVLLKHDLTPCITDFGVASILYAREKKDQFDHKKKYLQVGTPRYMAPEVLECSVTFTKTSFTKIDVYALSLVLWELLSRCHPLPKSPQLFKQQPPYHTDSLHHSPGSHSENGRAVSNTNNTDSEQTEQVDEPPPYRLPFEDIVGPQPDINEMRQIVVVDKLRPALRDEWRIYPASELCRAIEDGWEYDHDARISASCFVERVESLPQSV